MGIEDSHVQHTTRHRNGFWVWSDVSDEATVRIRSADPEVDFYSRHQTDQYIGIVSLTNKIAVDSNGRAYPSQYGMLAWTKAKSGIETRLFATEKSWDVVKLDMNLASLNIGEHRSFKEFRLAAKLFCRLCEIDNQYSFDATPEEPKSNKPHGFGSWS